MLDLYWNVRGASGTEGVWFRTCFQGASKDGYRSL